MKNFRVTFQPSGKQGDISEGKTILEASRELGVGIESVCGGERRCGKCKVRVEGGEHLSPLEEEEKKFISEKEQNEGYRLGCAAQIRGDIRIFVPEESRTGKQVVRKGAADRAIDLRPAVTLYFVELPPPSFHDPLGDLDRLKKALAEQHGLQASLEIDYPVLVRLPNLLRKANWKVTAAVWMDREILDVLEGKAEDIYGIAVDVGTTTIAIYLCHLKSGQLLATETAMNPQIAYGEDVMSRIGYVMDHPDGLDRMHRSIIGGLNGLIRTLAEGAGLSPENIVDVTMVGNTVMHHLLLKINPEYLALAPFLPAVHQSIDTKARELGLKVHPSAYVHFLPIEAGFVGADNVGVLIAERPYLQEKMILVIDVGTNGELVLGNRERLVSASCATGPAFEGAHIKFGMRAAPGAIERIRIDPATWEVDFKVVGQEAWSVTLKEPGARGICGSGIIDGVAELFRTGVIDGSGRFKGTLPSPRLKTNEGVPEFVIAWEHETAIGKEISITQKDVRNVQLAKGALYAGAKMMMRRLGIEKVDKVILAGAFGTYIDPAEAMIIGMFPDCDLKNVVAVGNAAGDGARIALLNREMRLEADRIARKVEYVELTVEKEFEQEFLESMPFPHKKDRFPHLKGIVPDEILGVHS